MTESFWVYENWIRYKAVVHGGDCPFCNNGRGIHPDRLRQNSRWHGPFDTVGEAWNLALFTGRKDVRACKICSPLVSDVDTKMVGEVLS